MISKRLRAAYWENDRPASNMLDVFSKGIDSGQLNKLAACEDLAFIDIKPEKGYSFVHIITTGAGEYFGSNNNADYFNESARKVTFPEGLVKEAMLGGGLTEYHKTYRDHGAVYRDHFNSKKGASPEGEIVWENYNKVGHRGELVVKLENEKWADDLEKLANDEPIFWSQGCGVEYDICFVKGALVETKCSTGVPIETLVPGDWVKTHKGHYRKVMEVYKRKYSGKLYSFKLADNYKYMSKMTENHPVLALRGADARACHGSVGDGIKRRCTYRDGSCVVCGKPTPKPTWIRADEIAINDYLVYPKVQSSNIYYNEARAYLLGFYLGDGHVINAGSWRNGKGPRKDKGLGFSLDLTAWEGIRDHFELMASLANVRNLPRYHDYVEKGCRTYQLFDQKLAAEAQELCGKGSWSKFISKKILDWDEEARLSFLAGYLDSDGSVDAKKGQGRFCTVNEDIAQDLRTLLLSVDIIPSIHKSGISYFCFISTQDVEKLSRYSIKALTNRKTNLINKNNGKQLRLDEYYAFPVKDISIKNTTKAEPVYNIKVDKDETYIVEGYVVHNCSICSNKAKSRADYCSHLRFQKLAIDSNGNMVFAYNDKPHFHDISRVSRPADRIAFGLQKVASVGSNQEIDTYIAQEDLYLPASLVRAISSKKEADRYEILEKLAKLEQEVHREKTDALQVLTASFIKTSAEEDKIVKDLEGISTEKLFSSLLNNNSMLTPNTFVRIVLKKKPSEVEGVEGFPKALSTVFGDLMEGGDLPTLTDDGSYMPGLKFPDRAIEDKVKGLSESLSLDEEPVSRRVIKITISGMPKMNKESAMDEPTPAAKYLAKEYAKYQLTFLANSDKDNLLMAVLQNQIKE